MGAVQRCGFGDRGKVSTLNYKIPPPLIFPHTPKIPRLDGWFNIPERYGVAKNESLWIKICATRAHGQASSRRSVRGNRLLISEAT